MSSWIKRLSSQEYNPTFQGQLVNILVPSRQGTAGRESRNIQIVYLTAFPIINLDLGGGWEDM